MKARSLFSVHGLEVVREQVILEGIDWQVAPHEHWVILGANGSGKTSLLRALTGYLMPTRGEIQIRTARYGSADWREVRRWIGLVSTSLGQQIEPDQRAGDVVFSGLDAQINTYQMVSPEQKRKVVRILKQIRAMSLADRPWACLSQGERQRILIGRALAGRPRLLFLDEPCAGLDPVAREDFLGFLGELAQSPKSPNLVLITHHVEEIIPCFRHALLLKGGRVLAQGPREKVMTSANLSATFGAEVELREEGIREAMRYRLEMASRSQINSFQVTS